MTMVGHKPATKDSLISRSRTKMKRARMDVLARTHDPFEEKRRKLEGRME